MAPPPQEPHVMNESTENLPHLKTEDWSKNSHALQNTKFYYIKKEERMKIKGKEHSPGKYGHENWWQMKVVIKLSMMKRNQTIVPLKQWV